MKSAPVLILNKFTKWSDNFDTGKWDNFLLSSNIIVSAKSSECFYPAHWTTLSIKCAFNGSEYYVRDKYRLRVDDSRFMVMNFGEVYESYIDSDTEVESFTIFFSPDFVKKTIGCLITSDDRLLDNYSNSKTVYDTINFHEKLHCYNNKLSQWLLDLKNSVNYGAGTALVNEKLSFMLEELLLSHRDMQREINSLPKAKLSTKIEIYKRLTIAKDIMDSNFSEKISLNELARNVCMNEYHFLREFKKYFRLTPHKYIMERRIEEAKSLLENTGKSITEIALSVGFEYLSSFTKLFTKRLQISPEKYRLLSNK